jgi:two-component system chemotaxis response regulator CheY
MILTPPSMLITDDDRDFRETLREVFEPQGFRTILAGDGEEALQIIRQQQIHVVLLDMHMPRLTGLETAQRFRESRIEVPCILLSAALDDFLVEAARQVPMFASVSKPVSFRDITRLVSAAMREAHQWP